ncbi:tRNA dimethylallyltransferase [Paenalcaligenes hominis]|uniref:tRNA dimethylallyltransferase n=1 Tax=Paenalcaligenes hominis TaxID=643674 RepID=A0A1U9K1V6_9BURK|nr:tRNA (adenosine(37)-N6)-dimethylallyltransferase MiaA [Paenalcaligenes hominis]AQS52025.1 tRNA (adenosine(37)-N6)-dimethylallyltransferase MiaA [Paenalcaligenes hominis]NJB64694.1 tRNA dimethylallyltransferase [Paenalcaligenes hominis]GGE59817.1 tRNA dimethylallyltransferase [Paenalcaligenes hominis]
MAAPTVICLTGPTAAGKSASTLALARRWDLEIIVMDSATIYTGMDIGTAKPSKTEQAITPHHLLDIRDPAESYSAASFVQDTERLIDAIHQRQRHVLLCGGTLLYYKALRDGLSQLPESTPHLRAELDAEALIKGWPTLHAELARIDPETAARLAPNDGQRIQRALEIYRASGKPMSVWLKEQPPRPVQQRNYLTISVEPTERQLLSPRIEARYHQMLEQGLVAEVEQLYARADLHNGLPSIRSVGYRQIWDYLDGVLSLDDAVERAISATRQLAKRQMTWLRAMPEREQVDCMNPARADLVVDVVAKHW